MEVISLEKGKVTIKENEVIKKSNKKELNNLLHAHKKINGQNIFIMGTDYNVVVPEVYDFADGNIIMEKCYGNNLEIMLRNNKTHSMGVEYNNQILKEFIKKKFFWKDYAPRNILVNHNSISIMDFERGIDEENVHLLEYFLDSVYEEYGAFLLPEERFFKIDDFFNTKSDSIISINEIGSKRVKKILEVMGYENTIPFGAYVLAVRMIVINETPYVKDNDIVYPLIELEEYIANEGYEKYTDRIIWGYYEKTRSL